MRSPAERRANNHRGLDTRKVLEEHLLFSFFAQHQYSAYCDHMQGINNLWPNLGNTLHLPRPQSYLLQVNKCLRHRLSQEVNHSHVCKKVSYRQVADTKKPLF